MRKISHKIYYSGSPIRSVESLAQTLSLSETQLLNFLPKIPESYIEFTKNVRGKNRDLVEPKKELKTLLKRINNRIFCHIVFPHYLHGGVKGVPPRDFLSNANSHKNAEEIIAVDIKNFFPSITFDQVKKIYTQLFKFSDDVSEILTKLTTYHDRLPQGSPTSSVISNLVMFEMEYKVVASIEGNGWTYTRLIDDITVSSKTGFSAKNKTDIFDNIVRLVKNYNFTVHPGKKFIYSRSNSQDLMKVTGLWLNRGIPKVLPIKRKEISWKVNELNKAASVRDARYTNDYHIEYESISGKVALLTRVGHKDGEKLRLILSNIKPLFSSEHTAYIAKRLNAFCDNPPGNKNSIGFLKRFYKFQHLVGIIKRSNAAMARKLQKRLNAIRPAVTLKDLE